MKFICALILSLFLVSIANAANTSVVTLDLERCQLVYRNAFSFQSLHTGQSYDLENEYEANSQKKKNLGRKLANDELILDSELDIAVQKIESILTQEFSAPPIEKIGRRFGFFQLKWINGVVLFADGSTDEMHLRLGIPVDKAAIIPRITSDNTLDYVKAILQNKIVDEEELDHGAYTELVVNCSGVGVQFTFMVDKDKIIYNHKTGKDEFSRKDLKLRYVNIDLSANYSKSSSKTSSFSQHSPANSEKSLHPYSVGDRVYAIFQNGKKCSATILIPGNEQSKIEYNEWCEIGFISSKSKGESEWAPNEALSPR